MQSVNFEFLRRNAPDLAELGGLAEAYAHTDPASSIVKLRLFVERLVEEVCAWQRLPTYERESLYELLRRPDVEEALPKAIRFKIDAMRVHGNKGAHGETVSVKTAIWALNEVFDLGRWFFLARHSGASAKSLAFVEPPHGGIEAQKAVRLAQEKEEALKELAEREAQVEKLMQELDAMRASVAVAEMPRAPIQVLDDSADYGAAEFDDFDLESLDFSIEGEPSQVIASSPSEAHIASEALGFDEAITRQRIIDAELVAAGWNVGANGANTDEVTQEEEVHHQPTDSGLGYADYVLWDENGTPLAVIEAKRTSVSVERGKTQARIYADGLEKDHGQRPVIFYTNGFDIWIWDDKQNYPPRQLFGYYSKDSLQYLQYQRAYGQQLDTLAPRSDIIDRLYQQEAVKRVNERFTSNHRRALIVQATGTGKTRVAVALSDLLIRAGWVKRILFLCDRRELRKQAFNAFNQFIDEPMTRLSKHSAGDTTHRLFFATYPGAMQIFRNFDAGFFDLIIADESHRSIYKVYRDLFSYFDSLQLGLTATPVEFVQRNTFSLFNCDTQHPTFDYPYETAVEEKYLVPFEVKTHTTEFLRKGIKYENLSEEQRDELEEQGEDPKLLDYDAKQVDKLIFNKDTNRKIIRNLMEEGERDASGQQIGKTIIFARRHTHAVLLQQMFDELYPQYGGRFCQVIDNYDPRAEDLISEFKEPGELTIAISVDMLDTGIDVPEVQNLVFAKPVFSKVKFWQMIGRGTRLCKNLLGPGENKKKFLIFDHWGNFDYFDFHYKHAEPSESKPLMQVLFEARLDLCEQALQSAQPELFNVAIGLIEDDINALPDDSIAVREKWQAKATLADSNVLHQFDPATVQGLRADIAPLMRAMNIRGQTEARKFDLLVSRMQIELLRESSHFDDLRIELLDRVNDLQGNLNPVRGKAELIRDVRGTTWWADINCAKLEQLREELRGIIHHRRTGVVPAVDSRVIDVTDTGVQMADRPSRVPAVDNALYRQQVEEALTRHFDSNPVLKKIRCGEAVTEKELQSLSSMVLTQNPDVDLNVLGEFFPDAGPLDFMLRSIIGMESDAVKDRFQIFVQKHPKLTANQTRFLSLLQNHIARFGTIEIDRLYEDPFTLVDAGGIDSVFPEQQADELIRIIETFSAPEELAH